jgi:hypothetical protein
MLGKGGLRQFFLVDDEKARADLRTILSLEFGEDLEPDGIRQGVEDAFDGQVVGGGMVEWSHEYFYHRFDS